MCLVFAPAARAQIGSYRYSSLVMDASTGQILSSINADEPRYPASLTKLMTLYLTFEALRDRRLSPDTLVPVSAHAASMIPTKLGLPAGSQLTVEQAILALITLSANDAAAALGELLGGDEDHFANLMTLRARTLGMEHTTFRNASGLPDPEQVTTARDLAVLARHILDDFPTYYSFFGIPFFLFHGRVIINHDHMLQTYPGADGLKTGYTIASGHNLVTSAVRGGVRLIGVVLGAGSNNERDLHMAALLDQGFEQEDVPLTPRETQVATHLPGLIGAAQAAELHTVRLGYSAHTRRRYLTGAVFLAGPSPSLLRHHAEYRSDYRLVRADPASGCPHPRHRACGPSRIEPRHLASQ
ncbi:MAG: D-alanyl-D-alanine carboxypeptidase [Acetobacteraceae bacterium]|nr:D-alanyl-D-alanine carboxypeptidase [Acetobacteraceae bacterium]